MSDLIEWYYNNSAPNRWYGVMQIFNARIIIFVEKSDIFNPRIWGSYDRHEEFAKENICHTKVTFKNVVETYCIKQYLDHDKLGDDEYIVAKIIRPLIDTRFGPIMENLNDKDREKFKNVSDAITRLYSTAYTNEFNS